MMTARVRRAVLGARGVVASSSASAAGGRADADAAVSARFTSTWGRAARAGVTAYERGWGVERSEAGSGLRRSRTRIDSENWSTERAVARCSRRRTQYCTK